MERRPHTEVIATYGKVGLVGLFAGLAVVTSLLFILFPAKAILAILRWDRARNRPKLGRVRRG